MRIQGHLIKDTEDLLAFRTVCLSTLSHQVESDFYTVQFNNFQVTAIRVFDVRP